MTQNRTACKTQYVIQYVSLRGSVGRRFLALVVCDDFFVVFLFIEINELAFIKDIGFLCHWKNLKLVSYKVGEIMTDLLCF